MLFWTLFCVIMVQGWAMELEASGVQSPGALRNTMLCLHKPRGHHNLLYALIFSHSILMSRFLFYFLLLCITILYIISRIKSKDYLHFNCSWQTSAMAFSSVLRCYIHVLMEAANHLTFGMSSFYQWKVGIPRDLCFGRWHFGSLCSRQWTTWGQH